MHLNIYLDSLTVMPMERMSFLPYSQADEIWNHVLVFQSSEYCLKSPNSNNSYFFVILRSIFYQFPHVSLTKKVNKPTKPDKHSNAIPQNNLSKHCLYSLICKQCCIRERLTEQLSLTCTCCQVFAILGYQHTAFAKTAVPLA